MQQTKRLLDSYDKDKAQGSDAWFRQRENRLTASMAPSLLGKNKYETPIKAMVSKALGNRYAPNKYTYHGNIFEDIARRIHEHHTGSNILSLGLVRHKTHRFLAASPDGIFGPETSRVGTLVEIKCPVTREINQESKRCPDHYEDQVQQQLECCDLDSCDFIECKFSILTRGEFMQDHEDFSHIGIVVIWGTTKTGAYKFSEVSFSDIVDQETPKECIAWLGQNIEARNTASCFPLEIIYWGIMPRNYKSISIKRDPDWMLTNLETFKTASEAIKKLRQEHNIVALKKAYAKDGNEVGEKTISLAKEVLGYSDYAFRDDSSE